MCDHKNVIAPIIFLSSQNKVFVYRGKEYEKIGDFVVRLQSQYPSAQVWKQTSAQVEALYSK